MVKLYLCSYKLVTVTLLLGQYNHCDKKIYIKITECQCLIVARLGLRDLVRI